MISYHEQGPTPKGRDHSFRKGNAMTPPQIPLAHYLFDRLRHAGIDCTFGIPGDFVLPLYAAQEECGMPTVICTHEPSVGYAADAYARLRGLGVALTTFGAGALNMVNPVAMAYAEHSPVLIVSGAPEVTMRGEDLRVHHMVKDFDSQSKIFGEVTVATASLDDPGTAADEIDRVLGAVMAHKRPGYLEIPRDRTLTPIAPPTHQEASLPPQRFNREALDEATREIRDILSRARSPLLYTGVGVRRNRLMDSASRLAEGWGLPVVSSVLGKAAFPESHPQYRGVFVGTVGSPAVRDLVQDSDCILTLGVINSDVNTGFGTLAISPGRQIDIGERSTRVFHHRYDDVPMAELVEALAAQPPDRPRSLPPALPDDRPQRAALSGESSRSENLTTDDVVDALRGLDPGRYTFLSDIGDAWFVGLELKADDFLAAGYYASMGFAVPGAVGAAMANPDRRPFVIVGDGAFQMTGNEIATLAKLGVPAVIVVLNNRNYKMLEVLDQPRPYYRLEGWDFVALAKALGCEGVKVNRETAFREALAKAEQAKGPYLIEAILDPHDHAPIIREMHQARQKQG